MTLPLSRITSWALALVLLPACVAHRAPESVSLCLADCEEPSSVAGETSYNTPPFQVSGASGTNRTWQPTVFWILLDDAGHPLEIRLAEPSGNVEIDSARAMILVNSRIRGEDAGWYRTRVSTTR